MASIVGDIKLIDSKGNEVSAAEVLSDKKAVGFYFSAHWCPPCRGFTPILVDSYQKANNSAFEIVFVSSDRDETSMRNYMTETGMPWLAVPFGHPLIQDLKKRFKVSGIPFLVIVSGKDGHTITDRGRDEVMTDNEDAINKWAG